MKSFGIRFKERKRSFQKTLIRAETNNANAKDAIINNNRIIDSHNEELIDWVRSKEGGYWNPKQRIRNGGVYSIHKNSTQIGWSTY